MLAARQTFPKFLVGAALALGTAVPAASQTPFGGLSPEGRARLAAAMAREEQPALNAAIMKARAKVLDLLSAEELDADAIADAQKEERRLVMQEHARAHARMLDAYKGLSAGDRQAFAAAVKMREARIRMEMSRARDRMEKLDQLMEYQAQRMAQIRAQQRRGASQQVSEDR